MKWVELNFSKTKINKAGNFFRQDFKFGEEELMEYFRCFNILSNWRSSHAYPLQSMLSYFRRHAFLIDKRANIVQRLKRAPSIIQKLIRERTMNLDRMEDIAGCRIVVNSKEDVYKVRDSIVNGRTRNTLRRERDYIKTPKFSGYRGIHLIYRYNGAKKVFNKHSVELQIRSKVQHSWATCVEVVGTFTNQALKASQGHDAWLEFFKLASIAFQEIENKKLDENTDSPNRKKLLDSIERLNVLAKLNAFNVTIQYLGKETDNTTMFYLLLLDTKKSVVTVSNYSIEQFKQATERYAELEKDHSNDKRVDVVLIRASSLKQLKKAYPNYFADTSDFLKYIQKIIDKSKNRQTKAINNIK